VHDIEESRGEIALKSKFIVFSDPVPGREAEYNAWYDRQHLGDILKVSGFVSAQRFSFACKINEVPHWRYCAIYTIDSDQPEAVVASLTKIVAEGGMYVSDAMGPHMYAALYTPIGEELNARSANPDSTTDNPM
jgi:hypothetical protein